MFDENESLALEKDENTVEQTAEEVVEEGLKEEIDTESNESVKPEEEKKLYTEDELNQRVDELLSKKIARKANQIEREYRKKYSKLESVLNAGLGTNSVEDATEELSKFYTEKGIHVPTEPVYSESDEKVLAEADANLIISLGYDEIKEETDRLAKIGKENMSTRDKLVFSKLASERERLEQEKELASVGISKTMLDDEKFKEFRENLNPNLSLKKQYEMYLKVNPKKEVKKMGSMKSGATSNVKDFYTYEEASRFTDDDYKNNPDLYKIVEKSALKWK